MSPLAAIAIHPPILAVVDPALWSVSTMLGAKIAAVLVMHLSKGSNNFLQLLQLYFTRAKDYIDVKTT